MTFTLIPAAIVAIADRPGSVAGLLTLPGRTRSHAKGHLSFAFVVVLMLAAVFWRTGGDASTKLSALPDRHVIGRRVGREVRHVAEAKTCERGR